MLNSAVAATVRQGRIVQDDPLLESGVRPRTFRLPDQPPVLVRELGPRLFEHVPPAELATVMHAAGELVGWDDIEQVFRAMLGRYGVRRMGSNVRARLTAIGALLRRVVDPREYDGSVAEAEAFVAPLNELLAADGFEVGLDRGRPFARRTHGDGERTSLQQVAAALASLELRATVRSLTSDPALAEILISRLDEVEAARTAGAFVLAIVGTGSFIEGLLDDVMRLRDPEIRKAETTSLDLLLRTAYKRGWIQPDAFEFSDIVRQYRNFVHPRAQQRRGITPDADTVLMCRQPVLAVVNDLDERLPGRQRTSRVSHSS